MSVRSLVLLVLLAVDATALVVTVTHAAGRMGVSVVGQLRESIPCSTATGASSDAEDSGGELTIRAVVRSEEEAARLKLDLCGAVLRNGQMQPLRDLEKDLGIELFTIPDDAEELDGLASAMDGADIAVLLSAAHADFEPASTESCNLSVEKSLDLDTVVPGTTFLKNSAAAYATALASGSAGVNVRVPPLAGAAAARRLSAEIAATASAPAMRHVVMRSSMGVAALCGVADAAASADAQQLAAAAVMRMGGAATIAAQADAEQAVRARCEQRGVGCTVLRLGALVDSAGGIPLAFGSGDEQLLERCADEAALEPPLISRNDAARLVVEVIRRGLPPLSGAIVDAAWEDKWGVSSAGTEEATRSAGRQDLIAAASGAMAAGAGPSAA